MEGNQGGGPNGTGRVRVPFLASTAATPAPDDNPPRTMTATILLVEDNEDNRTIYGTSRRRCGHEVAGAANGEDGTRRAQELNPAVSLMDGARRGSDGWEATRRLKADERTRKIPVIARTAHAMAEDRQRAQD